MACLDKTFQSKAKGWNGLICPQHECADCEQKTGDAGGMLYRCRWCERAYCEDDFDFDAGVLLGENLKEFDVLGYDANQQAYYVTCHGCQSVPDKSFMQELEQHADDNYAAWLATNSTSDDTTEGEAMISTTTNTGSTSSTSGVTTPMSVLTGDKTGDESPRLVMPAEGSVNAKRKRGMTEYFADDDEGDESRRVKQKA